MPPGQGSFAGQGSSSIDPAVFRRALGSFVTGVTVVTTVDNEGIERGFTANSFASVSLDPPLVLVCLAKSARSFAAFSSVGHFAINILAEDQRGASSAFASSQGTKFSAVTWKPGQTGVPIIDNVVAWFECAFHDKVDAGDHVILVGRVVDYSHSNRRPLGFYSGNYVNFGLEREAAQVRAGGAATVGGIFERDNKLLLLTDGRQFSLPEGRTLGEKEREANSLIDVLGRQGVKVSVSFVFAIAHQDGTGHVNIYYRGQVQSEPSHHHQSAMMFAPDQVPFDRVPACNHRLMLERYLKERAEARFGIYVGGTRQGTVRSLEKEV
jgi:flavin reductase (DIM6/NTAB) family NADH-FMN oxidoreductase RutF